MKYKISASKKSKKKIVATTEECFRIELNLCHKVKFSNTYCKPFIFETKEFCKTK